MNTTLGNFTTLVSLAAALLVSGFASAKSKEEPSISVLCLILPDVGACAGSESPESVPAADATITGSDVNPIDISCKLPDITTKSSVASASPEAKVKTHPCQ
ncbi:MAG: hypothetical protein EOP04_03315 [Proteobacteria bacterium]|nr:MAG: hypothetical protein EOP04_03315 [Pseudomonadota bacterium]